ncbi:putative flagellin [Desulforapulum autotrophicum HRM2]|uniref:Flagellin n=1 Tax=Desulforapulum autotrophicum (strain ATCC 43914 / DSM 3382 / VKM B-1955 / HRM2) TaxID=177437 RepID=C0QA28_DESAH|nr:flagellin [Desulforapulum autotrophicum]ACN16746.1 putative flagellin [Desulforapulum autotrophicum HRM2]
MALTINTNISALSAHMNMKKTDSALSASLGRLSTGLRINKAADDASGMAIADSLKSQGLGLGQAIRNANDGINIVQTADGALDEAINIVNTIKTKSIQAAQDGQTFESRKIIQNDIDKLLEEVDLLASSTSFNGKKLLSGEFTNKSFQVGASTRETVGISIGSAETTKTGHVTTADLSVNDSGTLALNIHSNEQDKDFLLQAVDMQYNNSAENGIGALAKVINTQSDATGISAQAVVQSTSNGSIQAGEIGDDFKINGIDMGSISVSTNDSDGKLAAAINQKSDQTGVSAAVSQGILTLNSADGRAIKVDGDLGAVMGKDASNMSTFGELKITQSGSNSLSITDSDSGALTNAEFKLNDDLNNTSKMVVAKGSTLIDGSTLATGTKIGFDITTKSGETTEVDSTLKAGSKIKDGSTIAAGTTFGGTINILSGETLTEDSLLAKGSTLKSGTKLAAGTVLSTNITTSGGVISAGSTLSSESELVGDVTLLGDMTAKTGSILDAGSSMAKGSTLSNDIMTSGTSTLTQDMVLKKDSTLISGSTLKAGSTLGTTFEGTAITSGNFTQDMELANGSTLITASELAVGSTIGGDLDIDGETELLGDTTMAAGSIIASGSTIAKGTYLTNDITTSTGGTVKAGSTLEQDIATKGTNTLFNEMTVAKGTKLADTSVIANAGGGTASDISIEDSEVTRLSDIDVTSQEGAQIAIAVADSALKDYDKIRSDLGSTQNQLTSTISNISVTQINVNAAESSIRDVDFAAESQTFSKLQILAQSGAYAMAQANSSSQTVMSLLQ